MQDATHSRVGAVIVAHGVHVIQAHLSLTLVDGLECPLQVVAVDGPAHVSGGAAVLADVVTRENGGLPQRTAGGSDVVLGHVRIGCGSGSIVAMVVPAHDVDLLILVEQRAQRVGVVQARAEGEI